MIQNGNYLMHYGVLGQKWGVRRYQNKDGTLTSAGKKHLDNAKDKAKSIKNKAVETKKEADSRITDSQKKVIKIGAAAAVTALAAYGIYNYSKVTKNEAFETTMMKGMRAFDKIDSDIFFGKDNYTHPDKWTAHDLAKTNIKKDIERTALENSKNLRAARKTLKGNGQLTKPELERLGYKTNSDNDYVNDFYERYRKVKNKTTWDL